MSKTVVAVFNSYSQAESAARQVKEQGLRTEDISIVAKQNDQPTSPNARVTGPTAVNDVSMTNGTTNDNISDGVVTGGVLGGIAGLLIGAGSLMIPGLGIIAAAGPITGLLSGALTGGIVGGLVDLGIPEERSRQYETDIKSGKVLFSMKSDDSNVSRVFSILRSNGAISVDSY